MVDITDEEFMDEFSMFGVSLDSPDSINKLRLQCETYRLDLTDIVTEFVAFMHSKKNSQVTAETIDHFERDRLSKKHTKQQIKTPTPSTKKTVSRIYDANSLAEVVDDTEDDLLNAYVTPTSKKHAGQKRQHTPDQIGNKRVSGIRNIPAVPFSPSSMSPAPNTPASKKYSSRANAGEVVSKWGDVKKEMQTSKWKGTRTTTVEVTPHSSQTSLNKKFKYMFQKLTDKAHVLNDLIEDMSVKLKEHYGIEEVSHAALPCQDEVTVVGRIGCDSVGKLNAKSIVLEGSRETSAGKQIPLDVSQVQQYSLFPGQIVAMTGVNITGNTMVAKSIYEGVPQPLPSKRPELEGPLSVVVACGPFTTSDSVMFEPMADLVKYLLKESPDVCILLGPFVDVKNPEFENIEVTYEQFFKTNIMEQISSATQRLHTKLIVVPSQRDAHHEHVYPQPPFCIDGFNNKKIQFASDPCTLDIEGVVIGITSSDVLFHLGAEEVSSSPTASDRLARLTKHVLTQHSYYPLYPPSEDMNIDYDQFELYSQLPVSPHVLITPSDLRYFVKDVCGSLCINPGRLTKGQIGGTFCRLIIKPGSNNQTNSIAENTVCEILKI